LTKPKEVYALVELSAPFFKLVSSIKELAKKLDIYWFGSNAGVCIGGCRVRLRVPKLILGLGV